MATNVAIPEGFRIVNQTPQIPEGFRVVSNEVPQLNLTPEQKAQIQATKDEYKRKQAERDKDQWFVSLVENKQDDPLKNIARSTARLGLSTMQGIANAGLNPFTEVAEDMGADLKPIKPENAAERTAELAGEYGYDAAALYALSKGVGGLYPKLAPYTAPLTLGGFPLAMSQSLGSSLATGTINPESTVGRIATDIIGGWKGSRLVRPRVSMPKETKAISELEKTVGKDVLAENVAEAERTGRNLLEVGSDEITQRALQAKLQTPEARKILLDSIEQSSAAQPARTKAVINEALGTEGKNSTLSQVMENAKAEAQPIYKELDDIGDLAKYEIENESRKNIGFDDTVRDVNGDELFKNLTLYADNKPVGYIDYSVYDDKPYIEMIKVLDGEKRKGYGTELIKQLQRQYPDNEIDFGMMTDEGSALYKSLQKNIKTNPEYAKYEKKLANSNKKLKEYSDILDRVTGEETGKEQDKIIKAADAWQKEHWKNENYKDWLENNWKQKTFIDTNPKEVESQLANAIKNNDVLADTISRVKRANSSLKNLPDTDFRVVNEARKALSQASMNRTELSGYEARQALNELDPILNNITGGKLAQANKLYSDAYQFERAADLGRDVFNSRVSPDDMKVKIGALTANEKKAARIGLREEILNKIGSTNNQTNALNKLLPENVREKITTLAGEKEGAKIIDEAEQAVKLRNNLNKVFSGSQTAEKGVLERAIAGVMNFKSHPVLNTVSSLYTPYNRGINIRAAETLTDKDIANAYRKVMNARNAPKQPKGYAQSGLRSIIERLTEENN